MAITGRKSARKPGKYISPSFHGYVYERLKHDPDWAWSVLDDEAKTSLLGLMLIAFLDRLQYAEYDAGPVLGVMERAVGAIDAIAVEMDREGSEWAPLIRHLNRLNRRQLELMDLNDPVHYPELMHLALEMMNRIAMIYAVLLNTKTVCPEVVKWLVEWMYALQETADQLDRLALRHFYAAFRRGEFESLAAVCMAGGFLRSVAGALEYRLRKDADPDFAWRHYDLGALIALGEHFDFRAFDDDDHPLLPEVADLLFGEDGKERG